uniref:Protein kinase domain-containing protein n=1 Tax=Anopheles farauti TaxID=69004 RepID=A0A182QVG3_9DIPT
MLPEEGADAVTTQTAVQKELDDALHERRRSSDSVSTTLATNGFVVGETIGKGAFSIVKKAYWSKANVHVAIKIMSKNSTSESFLKKYVPRELDIIRHVRHDNVIRYFELIETTMKYYIVMEYAEQGSFLELLRKKGRVGETRARKYYGELLSAVEYLHSNGIAHRDIKCENVTLDAQDRVRLIDFGFARRLWEAGKTPSNTQMKPSFSRTFCGSHAYASPELLHLEAYDPFPADIWACGVVLYALLFAKLPFENAKKVPTVLMSIAKGVQFPSGVAVSEDVKCLLKHIFKPVEDRITLAQMRRSLWFYAELENVPHPATAPSLTRDDESPASKKIKLDNKN